MKKKKKKKKQKKQKKQKKKKFIETNNTNSDVTTSKLTEVLCRAARIAETITAGRPTYIKFTQAVNKTTLQQTQPQETKNYTYHCSVISNLNVI